MHEDVTGRSELVSRHTAHFGDRARLSGVELTDDVLERTSVPPRKETTASPIVREALRRYLKGS